MVILRLPNHQADAYSMQDNYVNQVKRQLQSVGPSNRTDFGAEFDQLRRAIQDVSPDRLANDRSRLSYLSGTRARNAKQCCRVVAISLDS